MDPANKNDLNITSNWAVADGKTLTETIKTGICVESNENEMISLESMVSLESCIRLEQANDEECTIDISSSTTTKRIKVLNIVSGCKYVEVCTGVLKEYHSTCKGDLLDDFEGMIVYRAQVIFHRPILSCSLKLLKGTSPDSIWIYGLYVGYMVNTDTHCEIPDNVFNTNVSSSSEEPYVKINTTNLEHDHKPFDKDIAAIIVTMKNYVDNRFLQLEKVLIKKLDDIENNQQKLTKLIDMLHMTIITKPELLKKIEE